MKRTIITFAYLKSERRSDFGWMARYQKVGLELHVDWKPRYFWPKAPLALRKKREPKWLS